MIIGIKNHDSHKGIIAILVFMVIVVIIVTIVVAVIITVIVVIATAIVTTLIRIVRKVTIVMRKNTVTFGIMAIQGDDNRICKYYWQTLHYIRDS